tara:strand:- start:432 stop:980 length:549 start_codon:yes stop_codon:yes gene_type:complete
MKLVLEIPNKLYYIQNFLDNATYKTLHNAIFKKDLPLVNTKNTWGKDLLHGFKGYTKKSELNDNNALLQKLKIIIQNNPFHKIVNKQFNFVAHSMSDGAGINWHNDKDYDYGITYYLNRRWNFKYGGEFLFMDKGQYGFTPVIGNSLLIAKTPLYHKVVPVNKPLVPRKTIQMFIMKDNTND